MTGICFNLEAQLKKGSSIQPGEEIKVRREFDEQGNLIKFDSIYQYNWTEDSSYSNSIIPDNFKQFFENPLFIPDCKMSGKPFIGSFDQLISPNRMIPDSMIQEFFGNHLELNQFKWGNDSLNSGFKTFEEFFEGLNFNHTDSISDLNHFSHESMDEMFKAFQDQIKLMEKLSNEMFNSNPKIRDF